MGSSKIRRFGDWYTDSIDGELIVLDGKGLSGQGIMMPEVVEVSDDVTVPYAAVVPHQVLRSFSGSALK